MAEIVERIPHKSVAYAFLEIRAGSANEFESIREEALKKAPHYGFAAAVPSEPKVAVANVEAAGDEAAGQVGRTDTAGSNPDVNPAASAPTEAEKTIGPEGLSPREKARAKAALKKGA